MMKPEMHVLAIEDNPDDAELIRMMLNRVRKPAFTYTHASRLSEGLLLLAEGGIDVALVDLNLPDGAGVDVVMAIEEQAPDVPLIVLTGLDDEEVAASLLRLHAQDYLVKGRIDASLLVRSIRYAIERKRAVEALHRSEMRFRRLSESGIIGIVYFDARGRITEANDTFLSLIGRSRNDLVNGTIRWDRLVPPEWRPYMLKVVDAYRKTGRITPYETEYVGPGGTRRWGLFGAAKLESQPDGIAFVADITERKQLEEKIRHLANHDALTGLPNRRLFMDLLHFGLAEARRNRRRAGLLFLDVDRFKEVNDRLGHKAGDELLRTVAERLTSAVRTSDAVARTGGDEFNILLVGLEHRKDIEGIARKIIEAFAEKCIVTGQALPVTISVGFSVYPDDSEDVDELFRYADRALYRAKEKGRNTFESHSPGIVERPRRE